MGSETFTNQAAATTHLSGKDCLFPSCDSSQLKQLSFRKVLDLALTGPAPSQLHHGLMGSLSLRSVSRSRRSQLRIVAVAAEDPSLTLVAHADVEKLPESLFGCPTGHGSDHFDTSRQITKHPIGRANKEFAFDWIFTTGGKVEKARVL